MTNATSRTFFLPELVRKKARRIRNQRGDEVEHCIDHNRRFEGAANILCAQNQKGVAGVAESEEGGHQQVSPVFVGKLPQADIDLRLRRHRCRALFHVSNNHEEGQQAGDDR